jgi:two-component system sensor histidine kinase/response regulator
LKRDRERRLEAGIDGYISKPIDRKELERAIASAVPASDVTSVGRSTKPEEENAVANNLMAWDITRALERLGGDEQLLQDVMEIFLQEIPKQMTNLRQAVAQGNADAIAKTAHRLKGELGYLGISELSQKAGELEEMGRKRNLEHAAGTFAVFETEISAVVASIRSVNHKTDDLPLAAKASGSQ